MFTEVDQNSHPQISDFFCDKCDYTTCRKSDYKKHLISIKHINTVNSLQQKAYEYSCKCGKKYTCRQGLWKHNKLCIISNNNQEPQKQSMELVTIEKKEPTISSDMVLTLIKEELTTFMKQQNAPNPNTDQSLDIQKQSLELQRDMFSQMMEFMKSQSSVTNNNINNGQINNTHFNLQVYLNETCKNAMTINDFLDYLQPTIQELEATAHLGYVESISRIIMRGFKNLEEEELPFHCTDLKREHIYVKNPDKEWVKETDEKPLLLRFVKEVAKRNFNNIFAWQKQNPQWSNYHSKQNDLYNSIVANAMSGATEKEQNDNYEKIMKNIMKSIVIDKSKKNKK
jgi:hypothetical protein